MVVTVIGAVLLLVVLVFSLLRFITAMAAVVVWILENVVGWRTRAPEQEPEAASTSTSSINNSESKKSETQQKAKKTEEPVFSTKLTTPIENVIKKTVNEDPKSKNLQPSTSKQKAKPLNKPNQNTVKEDNKPKPAETTKSDKSANKTVPSKPKEDTIQPNKIKAQLPVDDIGYSFFPVKEKSKGNKKNKDSSSPVSEQSSKNSKETTAKPSVVDQNKKKDIKRSPETAPVTSKKSVTILDAKKLPVTRPVEAKIQLEDRNKTEARETKKVCSSVSYANVVTNNIPEAKGNSDSDPKLEAGDQKEQTNTSAVITSTTVSTFIDSDLKSDDKSVEQEVLEAVNKEVSEDIQSQAIHEPEPSKIDEIDKSGKIRDILDSEKPLLENNPEKERENNSENLSPIINLENLSKSESSSIEVICEEQNIDFPIGSFENIAEELKESNESQTQFEVIKENLNKLIQFTSESEQILCRSDSSSICIIDNQTESIESEIGKIEETQPVYASFTFNTDIEPFSVSESEYFSTDDHSSNLDTFIVVDKESEQNGDISEVPLQEISTYATISQDLVEKAVVDSLTEYLGKEQLDAEGDYCILEKFESVQSNEKSVINEQKEILDIIEELQQLEKSDQLTRETNLEENSRKFIEETPQEESIVQNSDIEPQDATPNSDINKEFLQLEEVRNLIDSEEIQNNLNNSQLTEELPLKPNPNINEEIPQLEKSEEVRNIIDSEEIQNNLNNSQLTEEVFESSLKPNRNINEEFLQLEKSEEVRNITDSEEIQDNLNNSHLTEKVSELSLKIEEPTIDKTDVDHQKSSQEIIVVEEEKLEASEDKLAEMAPSQIRVLTLNDQEHQECTLYRIEKNWAIQFRLGPSLFGRKVYLYCNYPVDNKGTLAEFNRDKYQLLNWVLDEGCKNADDTALYTQIVAKLSGSFHYYFTFEKGSNVERQGSGFFLVDPILKYGSNEDLPLDCIQCQTVLAKNLGSFSTWEKKLQVAKESGYNMIHFTPVQELGASRSCYSLSEQLKFNPVFKKENGAMPTFEEIKKFIGKIRNYWKVTSICDIVLNHTANESEWIKAHPEVTYNCVNCPYMRPAYLLDAAFHQFSMDVKKGLYEDKGIPIEVDHEDHLNAIRYHFRKSLLETLKIEELFICDTNKLAVEFSGLARSTPPVTVNFKVEQDELRIFQDEEYKRLAATVDMTLALKLYNVYRSDSFDEDSRLKKCTEDFKSKLDSLNNAIIVDVNDHLTAAIENVIAGIRYFRVQPDGPRVKDITIKNPLVYRYFTDYGTPKSIKEHEEIMYSSNGRFLMAHNGWVMNSDPLKNFASPDSNVYLRRELIAWGDSVKLRYGDEPKDCPFLWEHMKKYVEQTAEIFDGVRLDNCHSTPIPVAEYLLDCARRVRPDLYVVAELFTNSDMTDNIFVNRLGITSLIREAMSAWDSHEEGRLVYRYGGTPVGSFYQPRIRPLVPSIAHALFLDLTHDNPSPVEKRSVFDLLPSTALVNMACCASGSNRGYDELVPHHIHVVDETRQYTEWTDDENLAMGNLRYVTKKSGIILTKKAINDIHFTLGKEGYHQVYVDQMDPDIVAVTRHRPDTHESYILVAFTAFGHPREDAGNYQRGIKPLRFEGVLDEIVLEATLSHVSVKNGGSKFARWENFTSDSKWVNGLSEYQVALKQHVQADESDIFEKVNSGTPNVTQLNFKNFKPGSVVVIKASLPETMKDAVKSVRSLINQFSLTKETELSRIIDQLTLADLNRIIYRCDQEERDEGFGFDTYHIPNFGPLVYAGLQGFVSLLANIRPNNDLGHPMCANLRDGNWMIEYIWKRLKLDINTRHLGQWIEENTKFFNNIPRYLVPSYFDVVVTGIYVLLLEKCYKLMSNFVNHGSTFVRGLSLGSVQFAAYIKSADLPVLSPSLAPPKPPTRKNDKGESVQACVTLSAGLPHFAVGYMRNWGRDTFISLRGLFILTGRFEEARQHILGYAACLRHGLIPNLLDGGRNSRFNCRDAVWWWLYCIKEYVEEAPNGDKILTDKVSRIFPTDDSPAQPPGAVDQPLHDVMQEALKVHFQGLTFRERNAGRQIDEHMTDRGFNNQIGVHPETGFVFGGNGWNCGTWMDKMGSSDKAGNRGGPATPRDGSAVELIGLSKAVITWLWKLNQNKKYPYSGVERTHKNGSVTKWTFKEWSDKIQANFEKYFWISNTPVPEEYRSDLIHRRGIYKDSFGASNVWADFQLRCNFPIAMVAAPELFTPQQAWTALRQAEKHLLGPLGMKTLDPKDWLYNGNYDNSNDSTDPSVANGFNYHQGPEWVWPVGFFLRAKLHFASLNGVLNETIADTKVVLSKHFTELQSSVWRGLPELTNSNGSYCRDSSRTQAWSMACILEVLHDLQKIESNQPVFIN